MPRTRHLRGECARYSEPVVFKVTKDTRERIRTAAYQGGTPEAALIRVLIEYGLALFEARPERIKPFHTLLCELRR